MMYNYRLQVIRSSKPAVQEVIDAGDEPKARVMGVEPRTGAAVTASKASSRKLSNRSADLPKPKATAANIKATAVNKGLPEPPSRHDQCGWLKPQVGMDNIKVERSKRS
jgi:hypothetical protein